jgi:hypothetical protein
MRSIPPSSCEPLEHFAHPIVTLVFFNITQLDVGLLPPRKGLNQDKSLCASYSCDHLGNGMCDFEHPVICRCRKHRQLARLEGGFAGCFPLDVLMVHLLKPVVVTDGSKLFGIELSWGETIHLRNQKFIINCSDNLSLCIHGKDSCAVFVGVAHSGLPSLHAILEESTGEDDSTLNEGGSSGFHISWGCNVVTPVVPITTT